jgi:hypothetical protein
LAPSPVLHHHRVRPASFARLAWVADPIATWWCAPAAGRRAQGISGPSDRSRGPGRGAVGPWGWAVVVSASLSSEISLAAAAHPAAAVRPVTATGRGADPAGRGTRWERDDGMSMAIHLSTHPSHALSYTLCSQFLACKYDVWIYYYHTPSSYLVTRLRASLF